jgi:diguanylate cyclase (GGDEF)-like protein/PAS domain S-box-containing protein
LITLKLSRSRNITARRAAEEALRDSEERFRAVFENALDALLILDSAGLCRDANPAAAALLGCAPDQLRGTPLLQWVVAEHESEGNTLLRRLVADQPARGEFQVRGDDSVICDIEYSGTPNVWPGEHLLVLHDISERKRLERQLTHQAFHDMLTGLPNRLLFMDRLDHSLARARRQGTRVGVLFLDLDNFKVINDSLGHRAGDQLLVEVARCLQRCVPAGYSVARLGGDEFTVIMEDLADADAVRALADAIAAELRNPIWLEGQRVIVSTSIGIALSMTGDEQAEDLLRHADVAMYAAKNRGKSLYQVFMPAMISGVHDRLALEMELRQGLEQGELCLYYQPIVDLTTLRVGQAEALVRWQHPSRGLVGPNEFIPLAESSGLIMDLGRWVIEEACRQLLRWQHGVPGRSVTVSVNLSAQQFQDPGLVPDIARILTNWKINPSYLKLELTERVALEDVETTLATLWDLKSLGVRLALDDFGVGYSSLNYLKRYAIDTLKLDRSFVQGLGRNREDTAIVRAILAFAQALRLDVVAEGIESVAQLEELRALGCAAGQGFYFAPALPPDDPFWMGGAHFGEHTPDAPPTYRTPRKFPTAPLVFPAKA